MWFLQDGRQLASKPAHHKLNNELLVPVLFFRSVKKTHLVHVLLWLTYWCYKGVRREQVLLSQYFQKHLIFGLYNLRQSPSSMNTSSMAISEYVAPAIIASNTNYKNDMSLLLMIILMRRQGWRWCYYYYRWPNYLKLHWWAKCDISWYPSIFLASRLRKQYSWLLWCRVHSQRQGSSGPPIHMIKKLHAFYIFLCCWRNF